MNRAPLNRWHCGLRLWLLFAMLASILSAANPPSKVPWKTDYNAALAQAQSERKVLLLMFTGSDWCAPCKRLTGEVFETEEMSAFAQHEVIPVYLDFPRSFELPRDLANQNRKLADTFGVSSYPTVLIVSPDEEVLGKLGYVEGGPKTFIRSVRRIANRGHGEQPPKSPGS